MRQNKISNIFFDSNGQRRYIRLVATLTLLINTFVLFCYSIFSIQKMIFYKKCHFELDEVSRIAHYEQTGFGNLFGKNNFDVYAIEKGSDVDLIYMHGSRMKKEIHLLICKKISEATGMNVIIPFYRGWGPSYGYTSEVTILTDVTLLKEVMKKRNKRIVIFGQSLGCAVTCNFALHHDKVERIILENPFYDFKTVIKEFSWFHRMLCWMATERWPNNKILPLLKCPTLYIISENDTLVPKRFNFDELSKIADCTNHKIIKNATHFNVFRKDEFYKYIAEYVESS